VPGCEERRTALRPTAGPPGTCGRVEAPPLPTASCTSTTHRGLGSAPTSATETGTLRADGTWHSIEQLVNIQTGSITIWSDGTQRLPGQLSAARAHSGFLLDLHGGHDLSYKPPPRRRPTSSPTSTLSLTAHRRQVPSGPATPVNPAATAASSSSIGLVLDRKQQQRPGRSPTKCYEGHDRSREFYHPPGAMITGLAAGSTHPYTVTRSRRRLQGIDAQHLDDGHPPPTQ